MGTKGKSLRGKDSGTSLVETAILISIITVMLMTGISSLGQGVNQALKLANCELGGGTQGTVPCDEITQESRKPTGPMSNPPSGGRPPPNLN